MLEGIEPLRFRILVLVPGLLTSYTRMRSMDSIMDSRESILIVGHQLLHGKQTLLEHTQLHMKAL